MKKCKNDDCCNTINENRTYCSLKCRNVFVNMYIRDYEKNKNSLHNRVFKIYDENPKHCSNPDCMKALTYEKRRNTFCSNSCSAHHTNSQREYTWGDKISNTIKLKHIPKEKFCPNCENKFNGKNKFCSIDCGKKFKCRNQSEYLTYKIKCNFNFNLSDFPDEFDFSLVREYGWYSPANKKNNISGISRDHMLSVNEGFKLNIDPSVIRHPANCKLMVHSENISKNKKSSITENELIERIRLWGLKYNMGD